MTSKGLSFMSLLIFLILAIIILVFVFGITSNIWVKFSAKTEKIKEQVRVKTGAIPQDWYEIEIIDKSQGQLTFRILNKNTSKYEADFDPIIGYEVKDDYTPTTVSAVNQYPVAYIAVVADNTSKFDNAFWDNLTNFAFSEAYITLIPVTSLPSEPIFKKPNELEKPFINRKEKACYWEALAKAVRSLPTIPVKRTIGPNFLALILVSEGRNDSCTSTESNLDIFPPQNFHFYMLRSNCKALSSPKTPEEKTSNLTLESYINNTFARRVKCYENAKDLFNDLVKEDLAPISLYYEPKNVPSTLQPCPPAKEHNVTIKVTKRTGVLGTEGTYSGKNSIEICYHP
jgi:hypothetical protein